mgnify:CR=1 FL=1
MAPAGDPRPVLSATEVWTAYRRALASNPVLRARVDASRDPVADDAPDAPAVAFLGQETFVHEWYVTMSAQHIRQFWVTPGLVPHPDDPEHRTIALPPCAMGAWCMGSYLEVHPGVPGTAKVGTLAALLMPGQWEIA